MNKEAEINKELIKVLEEKIQLLEEQKAISQKIIDIQEEQLTIPDVSQQCAIHWVAVKKEDPPNETKRYLTFKNGEMVFQNWYYTNGVGYWWDYLGVTHWAEIPNPPCT